MHQLVAPGTAKRRYGYWPIKRNAQGKHCKIPRVEVPQIFQDRIYLLHSRAEPNEDLDQLMEEAELYNLFAPIAKEWEAGLPPLEPPDIDPGGEIPVVIGERREPQIDAIDIRGRELD